MCSWSSSLANLNLLHFSAQIIPLSVFIHRLRNTCRRSPTLLFITDYHCSHFLQDYNQQTFKNQKDEVNETIEGEEEEEEYSDEEQDDDDEDEDDEEPEPEEVEKWDENEKKDDISDEKRTEMGKQAQTVTETDQQVS